MKTRTVKQAQAIVLIEKSRLIESEIFRLTAKYGVKTVDELDQRIASGKLTEEKAGEDLFVFDNLVSEREKLQKELAKLRVKKRDVWQSLQHLLGLPKLNFRT